MPVHRITRLGLVNAYLVEEDDGLTLIDTALPRSEKAIRAAAERLGRPIVRIVLTHAHQDHIGSLDALHALVPDAEVLVSARDARLLAKDMTLEPGEERGKLRPVGHSSGFGAKEKRELPGRLEAYETGERGSADPSRWNNERELEWVALRPELVIEVTFDHVSNNRIRHGTKVKRWRDDKPPEACTTEQLLQ